MDDSGGSFEKERIRREASAWRTRLQNAGIPDRAELHTWLRRDARHGWEYLELAALDRQIRACDDSARPDVDALLREASATVVSLRREPQGGSYASVSTSRNAAPAYSRRQWSGKLAPSCLTVLAACISLVACGVLWVLRHSSATYETRVGEYRIVRLDDGSYVHLNGSTNVRVHFGWHERRIELLEGEALFDVAHDERRPFRVAVRDAVAQALGTQFDVRLDGEELRVAVNRGRVAVTAAPGSRAALVRASESARVDLVSRTIDVRRLTADENRAIFSWVGMLAMNGMTLQEAVDRFNARNTVRILIDDPSIALTRLGGNFSLLDVEGFAGALRGLGITASVRHSEEPTVIHLRRIVETDERREGSAEKGKPALEPARWGFPTGSQD